MDRNNENLAYPLRKPVWKELASGIVATLFLFLPMAVFPLMGIFVSAFTPLPTLLALYKWGRPVGYIVPAGAAVAAMVLLFVMRIPQGMIYLSEMLLLGMLMALGMRRRLSVEKTVAGAVLVVFVVSSLIFWTTHESAGRTIFTALEGELKGSITAILQHHGALSPENTQAVQQTIDSYASILVRLLPGVALASTFIVAWLNLLVSVRVLSRQGLPLPPWSIAWARWKSPEPLVWLVIAAGFMTLLPSMPLKIVGMNGLIALGVIYLLQGLAIMVFYFERWNLPKLLRAFFYGLLFLQQFATLGVILLGLFDVWFDFRRLSAKSASGA